MRYAIIAGGEGSRLAKEGVKEPKPLVRIGGERLIDRLVRVFEDNGAESIVVAYRDSMFSVAEHLSYLQGRADGNNGAPVLAIGVETPSSMHSLNCIIGRLDAGPFCLTTVDTVFGEDAFKRYISAFTASLDGGEADGMMAVTSYIDDEKPLYVAVDDGMNITAFLDEDKGCRYVSAGIYGLTPRCADVLRRCIGRGESRMRNFQRALLSDGMRLKAFDIGRAFDIDHAADVAKAERFLRDGV